MTCGLNLRDLDALVRFNMRAKPNLISMRDVAHPCCVAADASEVEEERWSF
jgi:hypothetical protein